VNCDPSGESGIALGLLGADKLCPQDESNQTRAFGEQERRNSMQVQLNTDSNVVGSTELTLQLEGEVHAALGRFADRITRVEVHLSDLTSDNKTGGDDKRCMMEARLANRQPMSVSHEAPTVSLAIDGACEKLVRALDRLLGKLDADQRSGARQANDDAASAARSDGPSAAER